jgi:hydroxymethylglutaryl-CoA reductase
MDENYGEHHLLGNGYRLDLVSVPRAIVLRREDDSEVARFSIWDATSSAIEQAAEKDYRSTREAIAR